MSYKIIVCDDEQEILDIVKLILEDEGFDVVAVSNSLDVESVLEQESPELLIIDLWMPALSGEQVITSLRANERLKKTPIIVLSASSDGRQIAFAAGADDFVAKPFDLDCLIATIKKVVR
jgi:DNA-binding response OmpR family regulator